MIRESPVVITVTVPAYGVDAVEVEAVGGYDGRRRVRKVINLAEELNPDKPIIEQGDSVYYSDEEHGHDDGRVRYVVRTSFDPVKRVWMADIAPGVWKDQRVVHVEVSKLALVPHEERAEATFKVPG